MTSLPLSVSSHASENDMGRRARYPAWVARGRRSDSVDSTDRTADPAEDQVYGDNNSQTPKYGEGGMAFGFQSFNLGLGAFDMPFGGSWLMGFS